MVQRSCIVDIWKVERGAKPYLQESSARVGLQLFCTMQTLWNFSCSMVVESCEICCKNHRCRASSSRGVTRKFFRKMLDVGYHGWQKIFLDFRLVKMVTFDIVLAFVPISFNKLKPSNFFHSTRNSDNSSMLHMFNNNIYTDFRTAYNSSDLKEPKCHKTKH